MKLGNIGSELNAIVNVQAGATLTIEGDYMLPSGASITWKKGNVALDGGSLTGEAFSHAVRMMIPKCSIQPDNRFRTDGWRIRLSDHSLLQME